MLRVRFTRMLMRACVCSPHMQAQHVHGALDAAFDQAAAHCTSYLPFQDMLMFDR
jgi:hypothetical protein